LPELLRELKAKGYRLVHVVPRGAPQRDVPVAAAPTPEPVAVAAVAPAPAPAPVRVAPEPQDAPQAAPEPSASANDRFARAVPIVPGHSIRPFTSDAKPARNM